MENNISQVEDSTVKIFAQAASTMIIGFFFWGVGVVSLIYLFTHTNTGWMSKGISMIHTTI